MYLGALLEVELKKVDIPVTIWGCGDDSHYTYDWEPNIDKFCNRCGGRVVKRQRVECRYPHADELLPHELNEIDIGIESVRGMYLSSQQREGNKRHFLSNEPKEVDCIPVEGGFTSMSGINEHDLICAFDRNYGWLIETIRNHPGVVSANIVFGLFDN